MENIFTELSLVIVITAAVAGIFRFLRQPLIIAYIVAGILLGPIAFDIVKSTDAIGTFSQLGIVFLLFMVGLNLDLKIIKNVGKISLITGLGQIIFTSLFGFLIAQFFTFGLIESLYIALALTFSSTIIIMKLLSDKKDLGSVYGRISIGFLIVQDLVAMLVLMFISSTGGGESLAATLVASLWKGALLGGGVVLASRFLLSAITRKIADQQELLILFCIAWCFALAGAFHFAGFSTEIGALLAGVSLASSSYRFEIAARIKPLRDFFILMFFVYLGTQMEFANFAQYILPIVIFSIFILIGNPLIVMILMGA
ncbi:MAG: cation:proton antiporter, partial [Candidatus Peribacteraceae bacterium]|nr:cation:proton antiporter [Candidatus Peribacteraceae bacterium]